MLDYEDAMTRKFPLPCEDGSPPRDGLYNTSAHFLWIGDRTRQLDGAHIEYIRRIRNPIGIKVGPSLGCEELTALLESMYVHSLHFTVSPFPSHKPGQRARARHPDHAVRRGQGKLFIRPFLDHRNCFAGRMY